MDTAAQVKSLEKYIEPLRRMILKVGKRVHSRFMVFYLVFPPCLFKGK